MQEDKRIKDCYSKTQFKSKDLAKKRALQANKKNNNDYILTPYKCPKCNEWHLTKRDKETDRKIRQRLLKENKI